jgi:anaerobic ribonucleoside-triphosphate reductase activating protein
MQIRLNKLHFPVTSLGPGRRIGIWLQGCSIGCPNCISRDTWSKDEDSLINLAVVLDWCRKQGEKHPDGITISGGEPFEQPVALAALLDGIAVWRNEVESPFDILCYSGLPFKRLQQDFPDILRRLDAIIPEPFVRGRPANRPWRGSSNQPLIPLSTLGHERYGSYIDKELSGKSDFQAQVQAGRVWFIGIPGQDDMERLEAACQSRGVVPENVSWRA